MASSSLTRFFFCSFVHLFISSFYTSQLHCLSCFFVCSSRHIYWVDYNLGKIERTSYTGEDRYVVLKGLSLPVALALDTKEQLMYWSEFGTSAIKESDLEGNNINQIMSTVNAMGLTVLGQWL